MSQTVLIIGAGISKTAGAPLMNDFLDVAAQLRKGPTFGDPDFDLVFRGRDALQSVLAKATMDLLNLESVFAAFEMAKLLRRLDALPTEDIDALPGAMTRVIQRTLEETIRFPVVDNRLLPPQPYEQTSGPILRGPSGKPMLLDNLSKRVVIPALRRCALCGKQESGHKAEHDFKLDESLQTWHGWYSLRRGVATTLAGLTKDGMASKGLLRHTNLATTTRHYVKDVPENTQNAMNLLETLFNECSTTATTRPN